MLTKIIRKSLYPISHIFLSNKITKYFSNQFSNQFSNPILKPNTKSLYPIYIQSFLNLVIEIFHGILQSPSWGKRSSLLWRDGGPMNFLIIFLKPISKTKNQNQNQKIIWYQLSHFFERGGQQNILKPK